MDCHLAIIISFSFDEVVDSSIASFDFKLKSPYQRLERNLGWKFGNYLVRAVGHSYLSSGRLTTSINVLEQWQVW